MLLRCLSGLSQFVKTESGARKNDSKQRAKAQSPLLREAGEGKGGGKGAIGRGQFGMPRVKSAIRNRARHLRAESTPAERKLWQILRRKQLYGWHFRRQHPIPPYFADFACLAARLVIEADGSQHDPEGRDRARDARIDASGWRILRFWNNEILQNPDGVYQAILDALGAPSPASSPLPTLPRFAEEGESPAVSSATQHQHD